jgi:nucleoside-triphosphatase
MHVFLTGEIQVGKSTAIRRFLERTGVRADGFLSHIVLSPPYRELYIARFDTSGGETQSRLAARMSHPDIEVFGDVFDAHGVDILESCGRAPLFIMDELGRLEERSPLFKSAVFRVLDGDTPVLGVLKKADCPFLNAVKARSDVSVITVTEQNRDGIPDKLAEMLRGRVPYAL